MQQTEKYKLNLIESSDPFLPDALNENTQKVEDVLSAAIEEHRAETDARLTVLEARKLAIGSFSGPTLNAPYHVSLPFAPKAVIISASNSGPQTWMSTDSADGTHVYLDLLEDGFNVTNGFANGPHAFVAFG